MPKSWRKKGEVLDPLGPQSLSRLLQPPLQRIACVHQILMEEGNKRNGGRREGDEQKYKEGGKRKEEQRNDGKETQQDTALSSLLNSLSTDKVNVVLWKNFEKGL